jgi:hypothetical protein
MTVAALLLFLQLLQSSHALTSVQASEEGELVDPHDPLCLFTNPCLNRPQLSLKGHRIVVVPMLQKWEQQKDLDKHYEDSGASCSDPKDGDLSGASSYWFLVVFCFCLTFLILSSFFFVFYMDNILWTRISYHYGRCD